MSGLILDHLAICAQTLEDGVRTVEAALGVTLSPGGKHPLMGTHNRLLSLGPGTYLEVIAIDPDAPKPAHPRWFGLDSFTGPARLTNWVARTDDLTRALAVAPAGTGRAVDLARGDLRWRMGVSDTGHLPFDEAFPALIEWQGTAHPADRLEYSGCQLHGLFITHPDADALRTALSSSDPRVQITQGPEATLRAKIATPTGFKWL